MTELDPGPSLPDESPIIVQELAAIESSATEGSGADASSPSRPAASAASSLRRFLHHKLAVVSLVVLILLFLSPFGGRPVEVPAHDVHPRQISAPPSLSAPHGHRLEPATTTSPQVLRGAQKSVQIALIVALVSTIARRADRRLRRLLPRVRSTRC